METIYEEPTESETNDDTSTSNRRNAFQRFRRTINVSSQRYDPIPTAHRLSDDLTEPWYRKANAEPLIFLFSLPFGTFATVMPLFLYWARCIEIFSDNKIEDPAQNVTSICVQISAGNNTKLIDILEQDISNTKIYIQAVSTITTVISAPILGRWSDGSGGRRLPLIICLTGLMIYCFIHTASIFFYTTINIYYFQFSAELIQGTLGGLVTVFTLSSAIVVDDSRAQMNVVSSTVPFRIGISCAAQSIGMLLGMLVTNFVVVPIEQGPIAHVRGYFYAMGIGSLFAFLAWLYAIFCLRESYQQKVPIEARPTNQASHDARSGPFKALRQFVFEVFEVITEKREGYMRLCLNLCIIFLFVDFLAFDKTLLTLVVKRPPFSWEDSTFTHYNLIQTLLNSIGMAFMPIVMDKTNFVGKESVMVMIGIAAFIACSLMLAFAWATWVIFASTVFSLLMGGISPGYRTILPKMVPPEQTARLFSFIGVIIVMCPLISSLVFNNIYNVTMDFWPGFVFMVYALLNLLVLLGQILVHALMLPMWRRGPIRFYNDEEVNILIYDNPNFDEVPSTSQRDALEEDSIENQSITSNA